MFTLPLDSKLCWGGEKPSPSMLCLLQTTKDKVVHAENTQLGEQAKQ